jgi:hypothetical protein
MWVIRDVLAVSIIFASFAMQVFALLTSREPVVQVFALLAIAGQSILPTLYILQQVDI